MLRDLDLFLRLRDVEVGFIITTLDEEVRRVFEPRSSSVPTRLAAPAKPAEAEAKTWAFCGPLLPFLLDGEEQMGAPFGELAWVGVSYTIVDSMKLSGAIWGRVRKVLEKHYPNPVEGYAHIVADRKPYHELLTARAQRFAEKHSLTRVDGAP